MDNGDLVFQEVTKRKEAVHRLLVNARILADELRGVATDNQAQIGPALAEVDDLLDLLVEQGEGAQGHARRARPLRLDPRQHHRHRPVVRRLRLQPGRHPDRRVPADDRRAGGAMSRLSLSPEIVAAVVAVAAAGRHRAAARDQRRAEADGHRALPARGQRLRRHRRADPRRQRRPGHRGHPRGQLGARRDGVRRASTTSPPTPRPRSSRRPWSPTASSSSPRPIEKGDQVMADGADIALPDTGVPGRARPDLREPRRTSPSRSAPTGSTRTAPSTTRWPRPARRSRATARWATR